MKKFLILVFGLNMVCAFSQQLENTLPSNDVLVSARYTNGNNAHFTSNVAESLHFVDSYTFDSQDILTIKKIVSVRLSNPLSNPDQFLPTSLANFYQSLSNDDKVRIRYIVNASVKKSTVNITQSRTEDKF